MDEYDCFSNKPAHVAAEYGHCSMLNFLVSKGLDCACPSARGKTPLHFSTTDVEEYKETVLRLAKEGGADVHEHCEFFMLTCLNTFFRCEEA